MTNKVVSITKKATIATELPDGFYSGVWGGSVIEFTYNQEDYILKTEEAVRGIGFKVVVEIKDGQATFEALRY